MYKVILWRLAQFPLILAVIYVITFLLVWVAPGDPFSGDRAMDPLVVENLKKRFHAESPIQFLTFYPWNVIRYGNFGPSSASRYPSRSRWGCSRSASPSSLACRSARSRQFGAAGSWTGRAFRSH
jgi:oligopeptide transport system permease protein